MSLNVPKFTPLSRRSAVRLMGSAGVGLLAAS